jgi:hypothetical protein
MLICTISCESFLCFLSASLQRNSDRIFSGYDHGSLSPCFALRKFEMETKKVTGRDTYGHDDDDDDDDRPLQSK